MSFREVVFVIEDGNILANKTVCYSSSTVYVSTLHDYSVFNLSVPDCRVISYARVRTDEDVWSDLTLVTDDYRASYG